MQKGKFLLAALFTGLLALVIVGCGGAKKPASQIYKNAEIISVKNTPAPGKISVVKINSKELSQTELEDWYFNYAKSAVAENKFNSCVIAYTDKPGIGVTYSKTTLTKDVTVQTDPKAPAPQGAKCEGTIMVETDGGKNLKPLRYG